MMKTVKLSLVFFALWLMMPVKLNAQAFKYNITGKIEGLGNDTLMMAVIEGREKPAQLIKVAGKNDSFFTNGISERIAIVTAQIAKRKKDGNFTFFLDKGNISISGNSSRLDETVVSGTSVNDDYAKGMKKMNAFYNTRTVYYKQLKGIQDKSSPTYSKLIQKISANKDSLFNFQLNTIKQKPESMFSAMQLYLITDEISVLELESLYNSLRSPAKELTLLKNIPARIKAKKASQLGKPAPSFSAMDSNGKLIKLEDYRGKYVLLDFWASWCIPCRKENPGLIKAYAKFKGKPFEIISVAESDKDGNWRKAIADDKVGEWIHLFDSKDGKNVIGLQYGVQPIPDNFLIDPDGNIIARHLFGQELENKLAAIFK